MSTQFTVAIRTYNGAERLPAVLEKLQQQTGTENIEWEVLVVDNNSQDATAAVVAGYAKKWRSNSRIRYVFEPRQGAAYARDRVMREATSDLVGFLDDDNLPEADWVNESFRFGFEHPEIGAYGGNIFPLVDETPPDYFEHISYLLAVYDHGDMVYRYAQGRPCSVPSGPGLVIRKQAWDDYVPTRRRLWGRSINRKFAAGTAEDTEVMIYIHSSSWEVWHNPALKVWHHIPAKRWERDYLLRLALGNGLANYACFVAKLSPGLRPFAPLPATLFLGVRCCRLAAYYLRYHRKMRTDIVVAIRFNELLGKILSPFLTPQPSAYQEVPPTLPAPQAVAVLLKRLG